MRKYAENFSKKVYKAETLPDSLLFQFVTGQPNFIFAPTYGKAAPKDGFFSMWGFLVDPEIPSNYI